MKNIERRVIKYRNKLIKRGDTLFKNAIREQYAQAMHIINTIPPTHIEDSMIIDPSPIGRAFNSYYSSAADIAMMWRGELLGKESEPIYKAVFEQKLREYAQTTCWERQKDITKTTEEYLLSAVKDAKLQAVTDGLGVNETKNLIIKNVNDQFKEISQVRSRLIAQTEMTTVANQAAMKAAQSTNMKFKKFWSTSGMANVRDSHLQAEADSIAQGGLDEEQPFSNNLMFPGDPSGPPEEICNCHCSLLVELV